MHVHDLWLIVFDEWRERVYKSEAGWLKNVLANILLGIEPTPFVSIHCDCQLKIAIDKNKT